ncbi:hypothetical protein Y032_0010g1111 [Ancylostoma ceylanicum]|uniref:Uncharacterized protein n=1 Tax=Ancylostoma ceylanicum TaxID=53326 RepID=A0A016VHU3_9BILA|nr:hypothetical protein Y032_0010g1111 [Ancylostoma ceylanicum]
MLSLMNQFWRYMCQSCRLKFDDVNAILKALTSLEKRRAEIEILLYKPNSADCYPEDDHKFRRLDPSLRERIGRENGSSKNGSVGFAAFKKLGIGPNGMKI